MDNNLKMTAYVISHYAHLNLTATEVLKMVDAEVLLEEFRFHYFDDQAAGMAGKGGDLSAQANMALLMPRIEATFDELKDVYGLDYGDLYGETVEVVRINAEAETNE